MKNILRFIFGVILLHILFTFCLVTCITSCGTQKQVVPNTVMQYEFDTLVSKSFIDSVVIADTLSEYPNTWVYTPLRDYFTKKDISTRTYYKEYQQSIYKTIVVNDTLFQFSKRVNK